MKPCLPPTGSTGQRRLGLPQPLANNTAYSGPCAALQLNGPAFFPPAPTHACRAGPDRKRHFRLPPPSAVRGSLLYDLYRPQRAHRITLRVSCVLGALPGHCLAHDRLSGVQTQTDTALEKSLTPCHSTRPLSSAHKNTAFTSSAHTYTHRCPFAPPQVALSVSMFPPV